VPNPSGQAGERVNPLEVAGVPENGEKKGGGIQVGANEGALKRLQ